MFLDDWAGDLGLLLELSWVGAPAATRGDGLVVVASRGRVEETRQTSQNEAAGSSAPKLHMDADVDESMLTSIRASRLFVFWRLVSSRLASLGVASPCAHRRTLALLGNCRCRKRSQ